MIEIWKKGAPDNIELMVKNEQENLLYAEDAMAAQQRLIERDGLLKGHRLSQLSLMIAMKRHKDNLAELLKYRTNEVIDFALDGAPFVLHQAPLKTLGSVCTLLQELFTRICQARVEASPKKQIPPELIQKTQLQLAGIYPSSFGMKLTIPTQADLLGESLLVESLQDAFDLMTVYKPGDIYHELGMYSLRKYRQFVNVMVASQAVPKVTWTSPAGDVREWKPSQEAFHALANRLAMIRDERTSHREIIGTMVGVSLLRKKFEFMSGDGELHGRIPAVLVEKVTDSFNKRCRILIEETMYIDEATEEQCRAIRLLDVTLA